MEYDCFYVRSVSSLWDKGIKGVMNRCADCLLATLLPDGDVMSPAAWVLAFTFPRMGDNLELYLNRCFLP